MRIARDIIREANDRGIDPYRDPFKPSDLGLRPQNYGSFSDWCSNTGSSIHNRHVCLRAVEFRIDEKPIRYVLLPESEWEY